MTEHRMLVGFIISCLMIMIVFLVSMLIEPLWAALLINGLLGGIVGFLISVHDQDDAPLH